MLCKRSIRCTLYIWSWKLFVYPDHTFHDQFVNISRPIGMMEAFLKVIHLFVVVFAYHTWSLNGRKHVMKGFDVSGKVHSTIHACILHMDRKNDDVIGSTGRRRIVFFVIFRAGKINTSVYVMNACKCPFRMLIHKKFSCKNC